MSWTTKPLAELADLCLGKMLDEKKNKGEPMPYLANVNVRWGTFDLNGLREMRFEPHEMGRYSLKLGDIVMCEGGEPGRCAIWKDEVPGMMIQKALHRIRPRDQLDHRFLYYAFLLKGRNGGFSGLFTGSTIKHLPGQNLAKVEVSYPERAEQERIAGALSAYDDLIENNRRRIALLEQSARLLYREWFVHLRFPGHEHVKVVDGVPEGWRRTSIGTEAEFVGRGITPAYDDEGESLIINQKCIRDGLLNLELARRQSKVVPPLKRVRPGDVLINSTGEGTLGRVAQVTSELGNCTVDSHITIVRGSVDAIGPHFLGQAIGSLEPVLASMGRGSTNQTELSRGDIEALPILVPSDELAMEFESFMEPVVQQTRTLTQQSQLLRQARDLLLPRLMSGELAV